MQISNPTPMKIQRIVHVSIFITQHNHSFGYVQISINETINKKWFQTEQSYISYESYSILFFSVGEVEALLELGNPKENIKLLPFCVLASCALGLVLKKLDAHAVAE